MLCQKCQQRPATVFFTQTINNQTTQMHLCEVCTKEQNPMYGGVAMMNFNPLAALGNILNSVIVMEGGPAGVAPPGPEKVQLDTQLQCPSCGYQLSAFRQTGKLGCTRCYESFRKALEPVITGIHGTVRHAQEKSEPVQTAVLTVEQLREKIKEAVENERYEDAARLRDQIQQIEGK